MIGISKFSLRVIMFALLALVLVTTTQVCVAQTYSLTDLGKPSGSNNISLRGINKSGRIVGSIEYSQDQSICSSSPSYTRAFLYTGGVLTDLGTLAGATSSAPGCAPSSRATSINAAGQVVGWSDSADGSRRAFLYSDGVLQDLNDKVTDDTGFVLERAVSISDDGKIVGFGRRRDGERRSFLFFNGTLTKLGSAHDGGFDGYSIIGDFHPVAVNAAGQIAGWVDLGACEGCAVDHSQAALWENGVVTELLSSGAQSSQDGAINAKGYVAGQMALASGDVNAFIWQDNVMTNIGSLPRGNESSRVKTRARGNNLSNQVVGDSKDDVLGQRPFIYDSANGMQDINKLILAGSGWSLSDATGINDDGQIVGLGQLQTSTGLEARPFLLTPATPTATGDGVTVQAGMAQVNFSAVKAAGATTTTQIDPAAVGTLPGGYELTASRLAFDVKTSAVPSGSMNVCFSVPSVTDPALFADLRVLHREDGRLVNRTIPGGANTAESTNKTVCAEVTSLDQFVLARRTDFTAPTLVVPANLTLKMTPGAAECATVVSDAQLGTASATDNSREPVTISRDGVPAGNLFPAGTTTITYQATDANGNTATATQTVTIINSAPAVSAGGPYNINEGGAATLVAAGSDPDGQALTYEWDLDNNGTFETPGQKASFSAAGLSGPASPTVKVRVTDCGGLSAVAQATVNVQNVAPQVGTIYWDKSVEGVKVGTPLTATAKFSDAGTSDSHTATFEWNVGSTTAATSAGIVTEADGSGSATSSYTYTAAGIYTVRLTVKDKDGAAGTTIYKNVVVYNPAAGYESGSGYITSAAGSYPASPGLAGTATITQILARYGTDGTLNSFSNVFKLNYSLAKLSFNSTKMYWMVVTSDKRSWLKGEGNCTIGGVNQVCYFLVSVVDSNTAADRVRVKFWNKASGKVIYDTQMGAPDEASATPLATTGPGTITILGTSTTPPKK